MLKYLCGLFVLLQFSDGYSWQENIRKYQQCISCHVSPSGGGVLTEYGKGLSTQFATLNKESLGPSNYSLFKTPKHILLGGNVRNQHIQQYTEYGDRQRSFLMQADIELAVTYKNMTAAGTIGYYGLSYPLNDNTDIKHETRRYYAMLNLVDHINLRVGKFYSNFGIMIDDHTEAIRSAAGYGQNKEARNYEAGYYSELFNFVGTLEQQEDGEYNEVTTLRIFLFDMDLGSSIKSDTYISPKSNNSIIASHRSH